MRVHKPYIAGRTLIAAVVAAAAAASLALAGCGDIPQDYVKLYPVQTSAEVVPPCEDYPCGPYGTAKREGLADYAFGVGNHESFLFSSNRHHLTMEDIFQHSVTKGGEIKGILLFSTAYWCGWCSTESMTLPFLYEKYKEQGFLPIGVVEQDNNFSAADIGDAQIYADTWDWSFPAVTGRVDDMFFPEGVSGKVFPFNIYIDARDMTIFHIQPGVRPMEEMEAVVESLLRRGNQE